MLMLDRFQGWRPPMPIKRQLLAKPLLAIVALAALIALGTPGRAQGIGFGVALVVDTTADTQAADGHCSLREAIIATNNNTNDFECHASGSAGPDGIFFNIPPGGIQTITPTSPLPAITGAVTIDATGQPAGSDNCGVALMPCIVLDGPLAGQSAAGLTVSANNVQIRGLAITHFDAGIDVKSGTPSLLRGITSGRQMESPLPAIAPKGPLLSRARPMS
jgi:CSLREA domain-containing protein